MKITSKRLVSVLLCLAFALAMLPVAVFAETATTIYVQPNSNWLTGGARFAAYFYEGDANTWVDCTDADGDGNYEVAVPDGYTGVIFCRMNPETTENNWDNKWNQTADLTVPTDDKVVYVVDGWDKGNGQWIEIGGEVEEVAVVYYLRGDMNNWDTSTPMTDNGDGTWSVTVSLAAGTYAYKAADAGWGTSYPSGNNASVTIDADCDVTFVLDTNAGTITANAESVVVPEPVVYDYYVAGSAGLCNGQEWAPFNEVNLMTEQADGTYAITFTDVAAGTYEYKITTGSWDTPSYGYGEGNYTVTTEAWLSNVTITFNADTTEVTCDVEVAVATEPGVADIKWQISKDTTAASESTDLRLITYVDSLDYEAVTFNVTMDGETEQISCTTVYEAIYAGGLLLESAADVFGTEDAVYFATLVIEDVPADSFDSEISVSITWEGENGAEDATSETRTIVISDDFL